MSHFNRTAFLGTTAAFAAFPSFAQAAAGDVIRAGTSLADNSAVITYANELGYFKDAGVNVDIQPFQSGAVIVNAVVGGSLDVGVTNPATLAAARAKGLPLKFFAAAASAAPTSVTEAIVVRAGSPIKTAADMNGKTVAVIALKTMQDAAFLLWVDKHGGDSKTIKMIEVPLPEMLGALKAGRVDVALPAEPFTTQGREGTTSLGGTFGSMPAPILIFAFFATETWLATHSDQAVRFAAAIKRSAMWANAHPKESAVYLTKFLKLDPSVAANMNRAVNATSLEPSMLQPVIDNAVRYGMLDHTIDAKELIWTPPSK